MRSSENPPPSAVAHHQQPKAWYQLRTGPVVALAFLLVLFLLFSHRPIWHSDVWGHMKHGEWIATHGQLPATEPLSPFSDEKNVYIHWLSQLVYYGIYQTGAALAGGDELQQLAGGATLFQFCHGVTVLVCLAALVTAYTRRTGSVLLGCLGLLFVLVMQISHFTYHRPQQFATMFFALLMVGLARPTVSRWAWLGMPVLFVIWANCHASFLAGFFLLGVIIVGKTIEQGTGNREQGTGNREQGIGRSFFLFRVRLDGQVRRLLVILVVSVLAVTFLNPHGPFLYGEIRYVAGHPNSASMKEWGPMDFTAATGGHLGWLMVLGVVVLSGLLSLRWPRPTELLLLAAFAVPPIFSQRMMSWWLLVAPWVVLPMWLALGERFPERLRNFRSQPGMRQTLIALGLVLLAFLLSPLGLWLLQGQPTTPRRALSGATPWHLAWQLRHPAATPIDTLAPLQTELHKRFPNGQFQGRIWASETIADYLVWRLPKETPVFVYSIAHLFPADHWRDHLTIHDGQDGWQTLLDQKRVNLLVFEPLQHANLTRRVRQADDWIIVLDETRSRQKRDPRTRLLIALRKKPL